jgi:hypothetical protein
MEIICRQLGVCVVTLSSADRSGGGKQAATAEGPTGVSPLQFGAVQAFGRPTQIQAPANSTVQCLLYRQVSALSVWWCRGVFGE